MLTDMDKWTQVRRAVLVEGKSKRSVKKAFGLHWSTLKTILSEAEPPGYRMSRPRKRPVTAAYLPVIEEILKEDRSAPPKQRHTTHRIWERLKAEHGFAGGWTTVKDAVRALKQTRAEVFVPLSHPPGEAQADFGTAEVVLEGRAFRAALFVMTLPYSDAIFCCVFPRECTQTFLEGHRRAFEFFGGVPRRISYDNTRIAVARIVGGRGREVTAEFRRLQSRYLFDFHFCLVRRPNEKGHVENLLGFARRNFLVPVPRTDTLEALNVDLAGSCRKDLERTLYGNTECKAALLERERAALLPLPEEGFESRRVEHRTANSLSLVRFDGNDYSVPTAWAHHGVTAIGGIQTVRFLAGDQVVAQHRRCWDKQKVLFEPVHYLALLERKPGALDFARPLENWNLPACFALLRRRLEAEHESEGTREFIKVLRLLESATVKQLADAVEQALSIGATDADAVRLILEHRREKPVKLFRLDGRPHLAAVQVAKPDLAGYRSLTAREVGS